MSSLPRKMDPAPCLAVLDAEMGSAGQHYGCQRSEKEHGSLHGEKTSFVKKKLWSPPIPLVMEERCPLRSL